MAKLAAYAQYQSNQQSPAKSKSGKPIMMQSINSLACCFNSERDLYIMSGIMCVSFRTAVPVEGFDWGQYICSNNLIGAPVSCFKHVCIVHEQILIHVA